MTPAERAKWAVDLRRVRPSQLVGWRGFATGAGHVSPYRAFVRAHCRSRPKDEQIAELLIGDVFLDALLDETLTVSVLYDAPETVDGLKTSSQQTLRPHRGAG
ncbi:MAG TPA: hypothetical protein VLA00_14690 [Xanthobacteraceae bacterium]|nr:hypothetical protein [Xanthobacteraceae bacterium]